MQVAADLASGATVTVASRRPLHFVPQIIDGRDMHYWLRDTGFDSLPAEWLIGIAAAVGDERPTRKAQQWNCGIVRPGLKSPPPQLFNAQSWTGCPDLANPVSRQFPLVR